MRPRSIVFDLYGEYFRYAGGSARLGWLTELLGVFDVEPATVRVVMTRLRKEGWFDSEKSGREVSYRLNEKSWHLLDGGRRRIFDRKFDDWDRMWTQALVDSEGLDRNARKQVETALTWCGFGQYPGASWFCPHDRRKELGEMLPAGAERYVHPLQSATSSVMEDRLIAERCWDLSELGADYEAFIGRYQPRLAHFRRGLDGSGALVERTRMIQDYRRYPFRDPDLPEVLLPTGWRGRAAHDVFVEAHRLLGEPAERFVASIAGVSFADRDM